VHLDWSGVSHFGTLSGGVGGAIATLLRGSARWFHGPAASVVRSAAASQQNDNWFGSLRFSNALHSAPASVSKANFRDANLCPTIDGDEVHGDGASRRIQARTACEDEGDEKPVRRSGLGIDRWRGECAWRPLVHGRWFAAIGICGGRPRQRGRRR